MVNFKHNINVTIIVTFCKNKLCFFFSAENTKKVLRRGVGDFVNPTLNLKTQKHEGTWKKVSAW